MEIYKITNTVNDKSYIGQTRWDFKERYKGPWHKRTHNEHLKRSVKKYGLENFTVEIIEQNVESLEKLNELEDFYIDKFNCIKHGYNKESGQSYGKCVRKYYNQKEYELQDSSGNVFKIINLSQFCRLNNLNYTAMLCMVSGVSFSSHGYGLSTTPTEKIINPNEEFEIEEIKTGIIHKIKRKEMHEFAKKNNINSGSLYNLVKKTTHVSHGFKLPETVVDNKKYWENLKNPNFSYKEGDKIIARLGKQKYKNIKLLNKNNEEVVIENIYDFCEKNGFKRGAFYKLLSGEAMNAHGYRLAKYKDVDGFKKEIANRCGRSLKIKDIKNNKILEIKNITQFCREKNLNLNLFQTMVGKGILQYDGYSLPETDLTNYKYPKKVIFLSMENVITGEIIKSKNGKELEREYKILTYESIRSMINKKYKEIKGWKIKQVKYLKDYYPEINN